MKELLIRFTLDKGHNLPEQVVRDLGFNRDPVKRFVIEDNQDEQQFLQTVIDKTRKTGLRVQKMEIIRSRTL